MNNSNGTTASSINSNMKYEKDDGVTHNQSTLCESSSVVYNLSMENMCDFRTIQDIPVFHHDNENNNDTTTSNPPLQLSPVIDDTQSIPISSISSSSISTNHNKEDIKAIGIFLLDTSFNQRQWQHHEQQKQQQQQMKRKYDASGVKTSSNIIPVPQWNNAINTFLIQLKEKVTKGLLLNNNDNNNNIFCGHIIIDQNDECYSHYIGDNNCYDELLPHYTTNLPCIAIAYQNINTMNHSIVQPYMTFNDDNNNNIDAKTTNPIIQLITKIAFQDKTVDPTTRSLSLSLQYWNPIIYPIQTKIDLLCIMYDIGIIDISSSNNTLRIFIAGDRSSVGKSSICLGLIGSLIQSKLYTTSDIAYIKPATQNESKQLIQLYCENNNIDCHAVGPIIYYRGFTRAYLAGETLSTKILLQLCQRAVDHISITKKIIFIDGVGFPAVGSICGTDNATVAIVCGYPTNTQLISSSYEQQQQQYNYYHNRIPCSVLLVGGSGVGGAIDAYNLNACYFDKYNVPVIGVVFNKLSLTGYYSLDNCRIEITKYFETNIEQIEKKRHVYGFIPLCKEIIGPNGMNYIHEFLNIFQNHVNIQSIIQVATNVKENMLLSITEESSAKTIHDQGTDTMSISSSSIPLLKKQKLSNNDNIIITKHPKNDSTIQQQNMNNRLLIIRSRQEIESKAIHLGAAPSA